MILPQERHEMSWELFPIQYQTANCFWQVNMHGKNRFKINEATEQNVLQELFFGFPQTNYENWRHLYPTQFSGINFVDYLNNCYSNIGCRINNKRGILIHRSCLCFLLPALCTRIKYMCFKVKSREKVKESKCSYQHFNYNYKTI